jgi:hypothetical protein
MDGYYSKWEKEPLVILKWLALQVGLEGCNEGCSEDWRAAMRVAMRAAVRAVEQRAGGVLCKGLEGCNFGFRAAIWAE